MSGANDGPASAVVEQVSRVSEGGSGRTSTGRKDGDDQQAGKRRPAKKSTRICRYYASKSGCRSGDTCQFRHVQPKTAEIQNALNDVSGPEVASLPLPSVVEAGVDASQPRDEPTATARQTLPSRPVVAKPVAAAQRTNPREFQINQVIRRFAPTRIEEGDGSTSLRLSLKPSDPDFPFELESLDCKVSVPAEWPARDIKPSIQVHNEEIPKGFCINIERGFETLMQPNKTLLVLLNDLDRHLERFLSTEKAQTIKIVANRGKPAQAPSVATGLPAEPAGTNVLPVTISPEKAPPTPIWSAAQKAEAKAKRGADVRQLEARMGRIPMFSASKDGTSFNVPISYTKPKRLPVALQPLKESTLHVPQLYNLEPCTIKLKGVYGSEAECVENAFKTYSRENIASTLMAHINYLTQHLPELAQPRPTAVSAPETSNPIPPPVSVQEMEEKQEVIGPQTGHVDAERPHLIFLSQPPPEWSRPAGEGDSSQGETSDDYDSDEDDEYTDSSADEGHGGAGIEAPTVTSATERGVMLSFPHVEMTGIELLQLTNLSLSVKCDRCKELFEFRNIKPANTTTGTSITRVESCNKCAAPLSASYRAEAVHANSIKAGYIDLEGCTIQDMLPSNFTPTCSDCSTTQPPPGTIAVRGDTTLTICRECHRKMTIHIPETKFLRVSINDSRLHRNIPPPKRKKENLGITTGTELPLRGRCKHYSKSFRWFRFSCCNRVYPCDRCHDEAEPHANEHANRMICGWCSREQNYRPEDCALCQRSVVRKTGAGFWEGGKGTRDKAKMSRKDPRKFKRVGGLTAGEKKSK